MIQIRVSRDEKGAIRHLSVRGHAQYADKGQDIVCAAISAIVQTAILGIGEEVGIDLSSRLVMEDGHVDLSVPETQGEDGIRVRTILNTAALGFRSVQLAEPGFVHYKERRWQPCSK